MSSTSNCKAPLKRTSGSGKTRTSHFETLHVVADQAFRCLQQFLESTTYVRCNALVVSLPAASTRIHFQTSQISPSLARLKYSFDYCDRPMSLLNAGNRHFLRGLRKTISTIDNHPTLRHHGCFHCSPSLLKGDRCTDWREHNVGNHSQDVVGRRGAGYR